MITFITAGHPRPDGTVADMQALVAAGADVIELGMPFSDPMADGPVIQKAGENALAQGMTLRKVLDCVSAFRRDDDATPVVLMGYLNPIEAMGYAEFVEAAVTAGVDGVLVVDLPPEEAGDLGAQLTAAGLDPIYLLAPTSSQERIRRVAEVARGYVYYVSLKGITGSGALDVDSVERKLIEIRSLIDLPVGVGFGIKDADSAASIARVADAVVVGTVLVQLMTDQAGDAERMRRQLGELLGGMRAAMDKVAVQ